MDLQALFNMAPMVSEMSLTPPPSPPRSLSAPSLPAQPAGAVAAARVRPEEPAQAAPAAEVVPPKLEPVVAAVRSPAAQPSSAAAAAVGAPPTPPVLDSEPQSHSPERRLRQPRKAKKHVNYSKLNAGDPLEQETPGGVNFKQMLADYSHKFGDAKEVVQELQDGSHITSEYFGTHPFSKPIIIHNRSTVAGLKVPDAETFTVPSVRQYVGPRRELDIIDVTHQSEVVPKWSLDNWVQYYTAPLEDRTRILNVISLEFSDSELRKLVDSPTFVRDSDWIDIMWPKDLEPTGTPKVQYYCLMSVAGSYTDFHIDFGGTSVWYHVLRGEKEFMLVEPTPDNLKKFETWLTHERQDFVFFADWVPRCYRLKLVAGDTLLIPTGWIHSVFTPVDSLVFGGNYLLSYNIPLQLEIYDIEHRTRVPEKFRFPSFEKLQWYAAKRFLDRFVAVDENPKLPSRPMWNYEESGLQVLVTALSSWLESGIAVRQPPPLAASNSAEAKDLLRALEAYVRRGARLALSNAPWRPSGRPYAILSAPSAAVDETAGSTPLKIRLPAAAVALAALPAPPPAPATDSDPTGPPENRPRVTLRVREPAEAAPEPPKANAKQKRPPPLSKVPKRKPAAPGTKAKKKEGFIVGDDEGVEPEEASGEHDEEEEYKEGSEEEEPAPRPIKGKRGKGGKPAAKKRRRRSTHSDDESELADYDSGSSAEEDPPELSEEDLDDADVGADQSKVTLSMALGSRAAAQADALKKREEEQALRKAAKLARRRLEEEAARPSTAAKSAAAPGAAAVERKPKPTTARERLTKKMGALLRK